MGKQLTIDDVIHRKLAGLDPNAANARERDAEAIARVVVRHWGDDAPSVLERSLELAREKVAGWGARPAPPPAATEKGGRP